MSFAARTKRLSAAQILAALLTVDGFGSGLDADTLQGYTPTDFVIASAPIDADTLEGHAAAYFLPAGSYTAADVLAKLLTVDGAGSGLDADLLDGQSSAFYAAATDVTAAAILTKLLTVDGSGSGLDADLLDGQSSAYYLAASSYTAADVLAKLLTVDGSGSGLDADLLDGQSSAYFLDAGNLSAGTLPAGRFPALTGDVTTVAGALAATIANDAVSYAKMQNVSAASKLLGRGDSGSGDVQEITLGSGLTMTGTTLAASGGSSYFWAKITNSTEIAITGAGSATLNRMHVVSGTSADYDITISGLTPSTGDVVGFRVKGYTAASKQFRLDAGASGSPKIAGRTRYLVLLHTNVILLMWDGTDWQQLDANLETSWVSAGAITLTASTTNPTKGSITVDDVSWCRRGKTCIAKYRLQESSAGTAGTGTYFMGLPIGAADTTYVSASTNANDYDSGQAFIGSGMLGMASGARGHCDCVLYDTGKFRILVQQNFSSFGYVTATFFSVASDWRFGANIEYPVVDW